MKQLMLVFAALLTALVITSAALAEIYAGPRQWSIGQGAGTAYSWNWLRNEFATHGSGWDKAVTFIDNAQYRWHNTVRNTRQSTETYPPWPQPAAMKGHCVAHGHLFWGSCFIY